MISKKKKFGSLGPQPHWLRMSISEREKTKQYIKEGLQGYVRADGISIPAARRIYRGLDAENGFDLRHIERWPAAKLRTARTRIQALNTLTSRPFAVIIPRTKKQRSAAQKYTGQNLAYQKEMIAQIQIQNRDKAVFRKGKVAIERKFPTGEKTIKQRFLFSDYLRPDESLQKRLEQTGLEAKLAKKDLQVPTTFRQMTDVTKRMLIDMPDKMYGQPVYFALLTRQYGPIGRTGPKSKVLDLLAVYFNRYDPGGTFYKGHEDFVEQVIGFQMIGTFSQLTEYEIERNRLRAARKQRNKLRFGRRK
jgi:hypothetical protein